MERDQCHSGHVHRFASFCGTPRWLLGYHRYGWHRVHLLLHRKGMPINSIYICHNITKLQRQQKVSLISLFRFPFCRRRTDFGTMFVRTRSKYWRNGASSRQLRVYCKGMFWSESRGKGSQHCSNHRVANDMHFVCCGLRRSDGRHISRGCLGFTVC